MDRINVRLDPQLKEQLESAARAEIEAIVLQDQSHFSEIIPGG